MTMSDSDSDLEVKKKINKQKRKQEEDSSSDEGVNDPNPVKKSKPSSGGKATSVSMSKTKINGNEAIELGKMKYVTISKYSGRKFIDIREYYNDKATGEAKPGKKGISLSIEQFNIIKQNLDEIGEMYAKQ